MVAKKKSQQPEHSDNQKRLLVCPMHNNLSNTHLNSLVVPHSQFSLTKYITWEINYGYMNKTKVKTKVNQMTFF